MNITLKQRKLPSGRISLQIEYYKGIEVSLEGKKRHIREFENLKLFLHGAPNSPKERKENKEALQMAENILAIRQSETLEVNMELRINTKGNVAS